MSEVGGGRGFEAFRKVAAAIGEEGVHGGAGVGGTKEGRFGRVLGQHRGTVGECQTGGDGGGDGTGAGVDGFDDLCGESGRQAGGVDAGV